MTLVRSRAMLGIVVRVRVFLFASTGALIFACSGSVRHLDDGSGGAAGSAAAAGSGGSGGRFISSGGKGPSAGGKGGGAGVPSKGGGFADGGSGGFAGEGGVSGEGGAGGTPCSDADGLLITSASELADFAARGCVVFDGTLAIGSPDLSNLDALAPSPLRIITGALVLNGNAALTNVEGFSGLEQVNGSLILTENALLADLGGLDSLTSVGASGTDDSLVISSNPSLLNLDALGNAVIRAGTTVTANAVLTSVAGLVGLMDTSAVTVAGNAELVDWGDFGQFPSVTSMTVSSNPKLAVVELNLSSAQFLSITTHDALLTISLPELVTAGNLTIASNPELLSIGTLDALTSVDSLTVAANPKLSHCIPEALAARLNVSCSCGGNDDAPICN